MKVLSHSLYEKVKDEGDVKCPHKECPGLIVKVGGEIFEHPTPDYWEKTFFIGVIEIVSIFGNIF